MRSCFIQVGNTFTIQHKVIKRYLEKHLDNFVFDRYTFIPPQRDFEILPTRPRGREGITVHAFPRLKKLTKEYDINLDYDIFFINFVSRHVVDFTLLCKYIKKHNKTVVVGGAGAEHFRDYLDYLLDTNIIDYYVLGTGEKHILHMLEGKVFREKKLTGTYRSMDFPGYENYEGDTCSLFSMRGCPHKCAFCYEHQNKQNFNGPDWLAEWIEKVYNDHGITNFLIASPYFYDNVKFKRFFTNIEKLLDTITFEFGYFKPDTIDAEIATMLKKMNFKRISLGIETFSQRLLNLMNKPNTVEDNINAIELLTKEGVEFWCERMFGYPTETMDEFNESLKWFKNFTKPKGYVHNYDLLSKNYFRLCPYTPLWESDLVTIDYFPKTKIMKWWHDNADPKEKLFKAKLKVLNDNF